jgi:hypothetical protein
MSMTGGYADGRPEVRTVVVKEPPTETTMAVLKDLQNRISLAEKDYAALTKEIADARAAFGKETRVRLEALEKQLSDIYAERNAKLDLAASELADLNETIAEKTKDLENLNIAFHSKTGIYQTKREEWEKGVVENKKIKVENTARTLALDKRTEELKELEKKIEVNCKHADDRLTERLNAVMVREDAVKQKETALNARNAQISVTELSQAETARKQGVEADRLREWSDKLAEIQLDKSALVTKEKELLAIQADISNRTKQMQDQENDIFLARLTLRAKEENIKKREQAIKEAQNELRKS